MKHYQAPATVSVFASVLVSVQTNCVCHQIPDLTDGMPEVSQQKTTLDRLERTSRRSAAGATQDGGAPRSVDSTLGTAGLGCD